MELASWSVDTDRPVLATAIHDGHHLRDEVGQLLALDGPSRLREEDPWTAEIATGVGSRVTVHRSRFEVDLNRSREKAVYLHPDDAWGLDIWNTEPDPALVERSRALHDDFYRRLSAVLDGLATRHGGFVLYDVHSYNHRRGGPTGKPGPVPANPTVNLGTGSLSEKWDPVAIGFLQAMSRSRIDGDYLDVRANVRFEGGYLSEWVNRRYGNVGCALAIEFKKVYMDEWTNEVNPAAVENLAEALAASVGPVWKAFEQCR